MTDVNTNILYYGDNSGEVPRWINEMLTLTFDTNCINVKQENQALNQLEEWHYEGLIQVVYSTSVEEELLGNKGSLGYRRQEKISTYYPLDTGVWVLGLSRLGISTVLGGESTMAEMEGMAEILFPNRRWFDLSSNQIRDVMALHAHWEHKRDAFVTLNTKDFLQGKGNNNKKKKLENEFGILVLTP